MFDATIFAVKEHSGNRKSDGSPFHFYECWLELEDGSVYPWISRHPRSKGEIVTLAVGSSQNKLSLQVVE